MARSAEVLSHWHLLIDDFSASALECYASIEKAVTARQVPDVNVSRVDAREGGLLSAKREYLRVARGKLTFDICAAPYGTSYFFSWWFAEQGPENVLFYMLVALGSAFLTLVILLKVFGFILGIPAFLIALVAAPVVIMNIGGTAATALEDAILAMPVAGLLYRRFFKPVTYYAEDTRLMFQDSVHRAVLDVIGELRTARGLRALAGDETAPKMRDLLR